MASTVTQRRRKRLSAGPRPWHHLRAPEAPARFRGPGQPTAVVGHMGAPAVAPPNSPEGFLAAHRLGADGIELDLVAVRGGSVVVAHDEGVVAATTDVLPLDELENLLASPPLSATPVLLDVKSGGIERAIAAALTGARLTPRAIISTTDPRVLRALRFASPGATRSQTFPRSRRDPQRSTFSRRFAELRRPFTRALMPLIVRRAVHRHGLAAVTVNHQLVTPALAKMLRERGVELIVWTVDDHDEARRMLDLDVDVIITNDPAAILQARSEHLAREHGAHASTAASADRT
ncbi:MAG: glycerophosphodiester phosphodiesterase [Solirubrobacteraceae bacterium]|nr:glycerophosphodiester phosphodiesterase [Solirubrobacteraceae bacterium]